MIRDNFVTPVCLPQKADERTIRNDAVVHSTNRGLWPITRSLGVNSKATDLLVLMVICR